MTPQVVYRCFAAGGVLLYVGRSKNLQKRCQQHRSKAPWWPEVAWIEQEHHANLYLACTAEREAIKRESPRENIQSKPAPERVNAEHPDDARSLIGECGGREAVADAAGVRIYSLAPWLAHNAIPPKHDAALTAAFPDIATKARLRRTRMWGVRFHGEAA